MFRDFSQAILNRVVAVVVSVLLMASSGWSQSYKVLYSFNSTNSHPFSGLINDAAGNVYGTTSEGGDHDGGTVYELSPTTGYHLLYRFGKTYAGGVNPQGNLVFDSAGNLYGTTVNGGSNITYCTNGCGVVFELSPPSNGVGLWTETVLYSFCSQANCTDGSIPQAGVTFDSSGNLFGTTVNGGNPTCFIYGCGTVFELSPAQSGWTESVIYNFSAPGDGVFPMGSVIFDAVGNLYSTTWQNGAFGNGGNVFELSFTGSAWVETVLHNFGGGNADGRQPQAGLVFDTQGNLYGTTWQGGTFNGGTAFELTPNSEGWTETILHSFKGQSDGEAPLSNLALDPAGNVYGTTYDGGCSGYCGTVFKLTPGLEGQWTESLFRFPVSGDLGLRPDAALILDSAGNVYGTTAAGGINGDGVVFKITP